MPHAGTSVAGVAKGVVRGVKTAVDEAVAWAEKKGGNLSAADDGTGPYASPGTCAPSDLDPIASGILPAMPAHKASKDAASSDSKQDEE